MTEINPQSGLALPGTPEQTPPLHRKEIVYDRETHDFAMYLDGELVGFARTYHEAEVTLSQLVLELTGYEAGWNAAAKMHEGE